MNQDQNPFKIGMRTMKTALAVFICLLIHFVLGSELGLYSCIAAVVCMKETAGQSWQTGLHRFLGTLVGGMMGFLLVTLAQRLPGYEKGLYVLLIPLGLIICIWLCMVIDKKNGVIICCVVFTGIGLDPSVGKFAVLLNVILRMLDTTVGIVVAGLVNRWVLPFNEEDEQDCPGK